MKWLGQHIIDLIARFRSDVYLEDLATTTETSVLVVDSDGLVSKSTSVGGDLTSIVAGTGLSGTSLTGPIPTLNVDASQTQITAIGTIATGVWNGTAIGGSNIASTQPNIHSIGTDGDTLKILGDRLEMTNTLSGKPDIFLKNQTDDGSGPIVYLVNERVDGSIQAGEDSDTLGSLYFGGYDDQGTPGFSVYSIISSVIHDATSGEESGKLKFQVANHDGGIGTGLTLTGGSENNEIDVVIGLGASSTTTIAGTLRTGSTAALTNAGLVAVANQSNITGVGTISSGVWQGTTIKTAYIGDDQVTEDKLANTLLAEIDANTAKVTNVATNLTATTHASQITINSSDGTNVIVAEASGSIAGVMSVTHHDKLDAIEASATADQSKSDIDGLAITTVGTIDTGVWNGTAIASDQQKHLMHYQVQGYSAGSTNYVLSKNIGSNTAPFRHDVDIGSDGLTAQTVQVWMRTGGHVMPNACTLKRFTGWTAAAGGASQTVALFRVRLADDSDTDPSAVLLQEITYTASGNATADFFNETEASDGQSLALAAGDIIFSAIKGGSNPVYFNGTFEVEF